MTKEQFQVIVDLLKLIEYNTSVVRLDIERKNDSHPPTSIENLCRIMRGCPS